MTIEFLHPTSSAGRRHSVKNTSPGPIYRSVSVHLRFGPSVLRRILRPWRVFVLVSLAVGLPPFFVPGEAASVAQHVGGPLAGAAIAYGVFVYRPAMRLPWLLLAASVLSFGSGDLAYYVEGLAGRISPFSAGDVLYFAAYVFLALALVGFTAARGQSSRESRMLYIDSAACFFGAFVVLWFFMLRPVFERHGLPLSVHVVSAVFPIFDLVLLALTVRLALTARLHLPSYRLLAVGVLLGFAGDILWRLVPGFAGSHAAWITATYLVRYAALAAAALHPSMRELVALPVTTEGTVEPRRLGLLAAASLSIPVAFLTGYGDLGGMDSVVFAIGTVVIPLLVTYRLADLVKTARSLGESARRAFDDAAIGMALTTADGRFLKVNHELCRMLGWSETELVGTSCHDLAHPDEAETGALRVAGPARYEAEKRLVHADGSTVWVQITGSRVPDGSGGAYFVNQMKNITAHKQAEAERDRLELDLRLAQKLESIGQLAAGIAHEINTPIQYVGDSVRFLRDAVDGLQSLHRVHRDLLFNDSLQSRAERQREALAAEEAADLEYVQERIEPAFERIDRGVERVAVIVQAMRRFGYAPGNEVEPADLNEALETTLVVCSNEYKYVADVVLELGVLPLVSCNIGDLNQVFLNLIVNAAHAVADAVGDSGGRGTITISTVADVVGGAVVVGVRDTGCGIPAETAGRVYEPFYTTKDVGRGTGQGLAISRAIVERHGGTISFESELGTGTSFHVRLPVSATQALQTAA